MIKKTIFLVLICLFSIPILIYADEPIFKIQTLYVNEENYTEKYSSLEFTDAITKIDIVVPSNIDIFSIYLKFTTTGDNYYMIRRENIICNDCEIERPLKYILMGKEYNENMTHTININNIKINEKITFNIKKNWTNAITHIFTISLVSDNPKSNILPINLNNNPEANKNDNIPAESSKILNISSNSIRKSLLWGILVYIIIVFIMLLLLYWNNRKVNALFTSINQLTYSNETMHSKLNNLTHKSNDLYNTLESIFDKGEDSEKENDIINISEVQTNNQNDDYVESFENKENSL